MKIIVGILGILGVLGGLIELATAFTIGQTVLPSTASAIQISQIMNEGTYYAAMSIALFIFAGLCISAFNSTRSV